MQLRPHPRLFITSEHIQSLGDKPSLPLLKEAQAVVSKAANKALKEELTYPFTHNYLLERARRAQTRMLHFLIRWQQTGKKQFRQAALDLVKDMHDWEYWSWIAMREGDKKPDGIFDLSYGENCTTLAIAYDWLHHELSDKEKQLLLKTAEKWGFAAGKKWCKTNGAWWFKKEDSNWNTVCAGGLGMLCLAMYEDSATARKLLPQCEASIKPFIDYLNKTNGAWPEGTGYWNYGMRYAFLYLLSHQAATGKKHPLIHHKGVQKTISFPMDFCPNGVPCSFGDVNSWGPMPFHYRLAEVLGRDDIMAQLDGIKKHLIITDPWPRSALWLLFHPGKTVKASKKNLTKPYTKFYKGMDWAVLADQVPQPNMFMSIRGGTTKVPHGQRDLLSYHCVIGDEALITHPPGHEYLDTTFSGRREELFEIGPWSKNTLFINGAGIVADSELDSSKLIEKNGTHAVRLIASGAMGTMRDGPAAHFCGRLFIMLKDKGYLIIDRFDLPQLGRVESRLHSYHTVKPGKTGAVIKGKRNSLRVNYASNVDSVLASAETAPTKPTAPQATQLRWCSEGLHKSVTMATLLSRGQAASKVALQVDKKDIQITAQIGKQRFKVSCSSTLQLR